MKSWLSITTFAYLMLVSGTMLALWFLYLGGYFVGDISQPDPEKAKQIQPFITGLVLPLLTLGSTLLVVANLRSSTIQNFSNNFFKLIDQHHKLLDNIETEIEGIGEASKGSAFFDDLASRIADDYEALSEDITTADSDSIEIPLNGTSSDQNEKPKYEIDDELKESARGKKGRELLLLIYDHFFHLHQSDLGHYFRHLYHIVRFAERSSLSDSEKIEFIKILRAQLTNYELLLLAYNGLHEYGSKFKPLIEKYELLKSLNNERKVPINYKKRIIDINVLTTAYPHLNKYWNPDPKKI